MYDGQLRWIVSANDGARVCLFRTVFLADCSNLSEVWSKKVFGNLCYGCLGKLHRGSGLACDVASGSARIGYGAYYSTADMPIPMVADCADYETYRSGKFIPGIMGTLFSLVDKLVSSLSATVVSVALLCIGVSDLPTKGTAYAPGMNWVVIALFCLVPMAAWVLTLWAMKGYELDGERVKTIQAVNAARKAAIEKGMSVDEAMATIHDGTVNIRNL